MKFFFYITNKLYNMDNYYTENDFILADYTIFSKN